MTDARETTVAATSATDAARPEPVVVRTRAELAAARAQLGDGDVGVVMTMGALHEGHATLIRQARANTRHVIVTIFLNPLQFGPREDLARYPLTHDADMEICRREGADLVFLPTPGVVYPDGDPGFGSLPGRSGTCLRVRPVRATSTGF